jgi:hypothetical protein
MPSARPFIKETSTHLYFRRRDSSSRSFAIVTVGPCGLRREGLIAILAAADFRIAASVSCVDDVVVTERSQRRSILLLSMPATTWTPQSTNRTLQAGPSGCTRAVLAA